MGRGSGPCRRERPLKQELGDELCVREHSPGPGSWVGVGFGGLPGACRGGAVRTPPPAT